ncbi:MAG: hypothetical protein J6O41_00615 [Clostridia bacterium]|nr:hypothetical protein [Clostridia bacterium]
METKWIMNNNITIKIDPSRDDARREGPHCNVYKCGRRVGRIQIDNYGSVRWSSPPDGNINRTEQNQIESFVSSIAFKIIDSYSKIRG